MTLDEGLLAEAKQIRDRLLEAQHEVERTRTDYHHAIRRLHAAGGSMREIADALRVSHQRVHQIVGEVVAGPEHGPPPWGVPHGGPPPPKSRGVRGFERFTEGAQNVISLAQAEAAELGHEYIGTEHVLLGLLAETDGPAARALGSLGISLDDARGATVDEVGRGTCEWPPDYPRPMKPRLKKALELALREALKAGHNYLGSEHILLGLVSERKGVAARVLERLGADEDAVRTALTA